MLINTIAQYAEKIISPRADRLILSLEQSGHLLPTLAQHQPWETIGRLLCLDQSGQIIRYNENLIFHKEQWDNFWYLIVRIATPSLLIKLVKARNWMSILVLGKNQENTLRKQSKISNIQWNNIFYILFSWNKTVIS